MLSRAGCVGGTGQRPALCRTYHCVHWDCILSLTRLGSRVIGKLVVWMPLSVISGLYSRGAEKSAEAGIQCRTCDNRNKWWCWENERISKYINTNRNCGIVRFRKAFLMTWVNERVTFNSILSNYGIRLRPFFDEKIKWNHFQQDSILKVCPSLNIFL